MEEKKIRLNKFLAHAEIADRRKCESLINQGLVSVNGKIIKESGYKVFLHDIVCFRGKEIKAEKKIYILLNKPKNAHFEKNKNAKFSILELVRTFAEKLSLEYTPQLFPIDLLNEENLGLQVLTNDRILLNDLNDSDNKLLNIYQIELNKDLTYNDLDRIENGIEIENKTYKNINIQFINEDEKNILGLKIKIEKTELISKIFESLNYKILKLDRTMFLGLTKKDLPRTKWRFLTPNEVIKLKHLKY